MPLSEQIHNNKPLENISIAYKNADLITSLVSPGVPVKHDTDTYYVYSMDSLMLPDTLRAKGASAKQGGFSLSTGSYTLEKHSLKDLVTDDDKENADAAINLDVDTTEYLTEKILMRKEQSLMTLIGTDANWANETSCTAAGAWSANSTLSNPISAADSATSGILAGTGKMANTCVLSNNAFIAAKEHVSILDRIKYTSPESVTPDMLAKLFNVEKVFVSRAVVNSAKEGLTDSLGMMLTDCAWFAYIERTPGLKKPSALYTFQKGSGYSVKKWRDEEVEGDWIEVTSKYQHKCVASALAYIITNPIQ